MKTRQSIWLTEYEGLLPIPDRDRRNAPVDRSESRFAADPESAEPHLELVPFDPLNSTPVAFLE